MTSIEHLPDHLSSCDQINEHLFLTKVNLTVLSEDWHCRIRVELGVFGSKVLPFKSVNLNESVLDSCHHTDSQNTSRILVKVVSIDL